MRDKQCRRVLWVDWIAMRDLLCIGTYFCGTITRVSELGACREFGRFPIRRDGWKILIPTRGDRAAFRPVGLRHPPVCYRSVRWIASMLLRPENTHSCCRKSISWWYTFARTSHFVTLECFFIKNIVWNIQPRRNLFSHNKTVKHLLYCPAFRCLSLSHQSTVR